MRLTIINQFYRPDIAPTATLAASLAEHRGRLGDEVTVVAGKGSYFEDAPAAPRPGSEHVRIRRVWTPGLGKRTNLRRVIDYASFYASAAGILATLPRQDVIVTLTTPPLIPLTAVLHRAIHRRTRVILWNMDCYPDLAERGGVMKTGGIAARITHALNRAIFRRLDHLVCLDTAMARLLCGHYARVNPSLPVTIIPNWEEAAFFPRDAAPDPWARRSELGVNGIFTVLYLGNMGYGHEFATVLDAAELLKGDGVSFLFVAGGKRFDDVKAEASRRGLDNVVLTGYVPKEETPAVMAAADAALVTLRDDIIGIMSPSKIHSNLAMGLPLIYVGPPASNVDEAIRQHGCGVSLRHGQVEELASFVRRLAERPAEAADLRRAARAAFDAAYCDLATLPRFDTVIAHALGGAPAAGIPAGTASDFARQG
jgi:colanic acid biosynthesis glycosyl transferase WcaI